MTSKENNQFMKEYDKFEKQKRTSSFLTGGTHPCK
jgi:hypothetical protein